MKKMPESIKNKLRKLQKLNKQSKELEFILKDEFEKYGVDIENLTAIGDGDMQTEAYAFITYAEGDVEDSISMIEDVFLYYVNKTTSE